jgi:hypothetical protein
MNVEFTNPEMVAIKDLNIMGERDHHLVHYPHGRLPYVTPGRGECPGPMADENARHRAAPQCGPAHQWRSGRSSRSFRGYVIEHSPVMHCQRPNGGAGMCVP